MIFVAGEYDAGSSLQCHLRANQPSHQVHIQWRGEAQPSHFQISNFKNVFNDCKAGRDKSHACVEALVKCCLK
jgi:hypothetical protein